MNRLILTAAALGLSMGSSALAGFTTTTWTGALSNDWHTPGNWTQGIPTATIDAIVNSGTPTLNSTGSCRQLLITGGTILGNGDLQVSGPLLLNGGNISGTGTLQLLAGSTLTLAPGDDKAIRRNLSNSGRIELGRGSVLAVNGTFFQAGSAQYITHIVGPSLSSIGRLAADGNALVSGTFQVIYDNGFTPPPGTCLTTYTFLTSANVTPGDALNFSVPSSSPLQGVAKVGPSSLFVGLRSTADVTNQGATGAPDGQLTTDDLIWFLQRFLTFDLRADITNEGGTGQPDGMLTVDDLIIFLRSFFADACNA
jgi:hypothetical protein